ncbi:hypothetical protein EST38_g10255 [Candolleomyces aberdarensis]|uniref:Nephrocystin 3-like N-terminal domain-containing protein n=1 Tax=Candolleomyces aberdarensis TaxID=2316362 RepID=A0A4Q2D7V2_9AGAR|nr:hypothetical protein EST38_g10255 [Candolleomyces aberdarensis]
MDTLIVRPVKRLREGATLDPASLPYVILIDGLDECKGEDRQAEVLTVIRHSLLENDLPFRIFIASRPELAIRSELEPGGHLHKVAYHIQLSDKYDATGDIRRYLWWRLQDLSRRVGHFNWFTADDIETLVQAASGQFISAATAIKYISERRASPSGSGRLKLMLTWTPHEGRCARPFDTLDILYANILLEAKEAYEAVDAQVGDDFLLLVRAYQVNATSGPAPGPVTFEIDRLTAILGLEQPK